MSFQSAVADHVLDGVLFCAVLFPTRYLEWIRDGIESVSENFPTYFHLGSKLEKKEMQRTTCT